MIRDLVLQDLVFKGMKRIGAAEGRSNQYTTVRVRFYNADLFILMDDGVSLGEHSRRCTRAILLGVGIELQGERGVLVDVEESRLYWKQGALDEARGSVLVQDRDVVPCCRGGVGSRGDAIGWALIRAEQTPSKSFTGVGSNCGVVLVVIATVTRPRGGGGG